MVRMAGERRVSDGGVRPRRGEGLHLNPRAKRGLVVPTGLAIVLSVMLLPAIIGRAAPPIFTEDFESGGIAKWALSARFTAQQQQVFGGTWAGRATASSAAAYAAANLATPQTDLFFDTRMNLLSSSGTARIPRLARSTGGGIVSLRVAANGTVSIRNDVSGTVTTSTTKMSKASWHEVQVHARVGSGSLVETWIDGVRIAALSFSTSLGTNPVGRVQVGSQSSVTMDAAYDDVSAATEFITGGTPPPTGDTQPPTMPMGLTASATGATRVDLAWQASSDDVGVAGYTIYRGGAELATVAGTRTTFADVTAQPATTYAYAVDSFDASGKRSSPSDPAEVTTPDAAPSDAITLKAAGDICPALPQNCSGTAAMVLGANPDMVLTLGDNQYVTGALTEYMASYDLQWGQFKGLTRPTPGNHEWKTPSAQGYKDYFGPTVLTNGSTWYSFNIGGWHVVSLDSQCGSVGGCTTTSPQYAWLQQDLAADDRACTLAYWHRPRFSSGTSHGNFIGVQPFWDLLDAEGAELILNSHEHHYERFAPMSASGAMSPAGIRQFVVGTGGNCCYGFSATPVANSEVRITGFRGLLELTLEATSYSWRFIAVDGSVLDSGTGSCH